MTEKIHGTNFSIIVNDKNEVKPYKRSGLASSDFYATSHIMKTYQAPVKYIKNKHFPTAKQVQFFGEMFGGYWHAPVLPHATKIQKGPKYAPFNDWFIFDIAVDGVFQDFSLLQEVIAYTPIRHVPVIGYGDFHFCMEYNILFDSKIPEILDLEPPPSPNICEGIVLKPVQTRYIGQDRIILKMKNPDFQERDPNKKTRTPKAMDPEHVKLYMELNTYVTPQRLANVVSKLSPIGPKDFGRILREFSVDIQQDYIQANQYPSDYSYPKPVAKALNTQCAILIRTHFFDILNGNPIEI